MFMGSLAEIKFDEEKGAEEKKKVIQRKSRNTAD